MKTYRQLHRDETEAVVASNICLRGKWLAIFLLGCLGLACSAARQTGMISWDEYQRLRSYDPYVLDLNSEESRLVYVGVFHSVNQNLEQFKDILRRWDEMRPEVAFSEGGVWPLEDTAEQAIRNHGEQGLIRFLCRRDNVPIKSIEPQRWKEALALLKDYSIEQIKVFYILRQALIHRMLKKDPSDIEYVFCILKRLSKRPFNTVQPVTLAEFNQAVARIFPELCDWRRVPESWFTKASPHPWLYRMYHAVNDYRNRHMAQNLIKELKKGKRVFAVAGRSHVVMQEPVIRQQISRHRK